MIVMLAVWLPFVLKEVHLWEAFVARLWVVRAGGGGGATVTMTLHTPTHTHEAVNAQNECHLLHEAGRAQHLATSLPLTLQVKHSLCQYEPTAER